MKRIFAYKIYPNIDIGNGLFGGRIKTRNAIEAVTAFLLVFFLLRAILFFLSEKIAIVISFVVALIIAFVFVAGIDGRSITEYLILYFSHRSHKGQFSLGMPIIEEEEEKSDEK